MMIKKLTIILVSVVLFLGIGVAFFPSLASTTWGKSWILSLVNRQIPGSIFIEDLSLSWIGSQELKNLEIKDLNGQVILKVDRIKTISSLGNLLFNGYLGENIEFEGLKGLIVQERSGITNLERAILKIGSDNTISVHSEDYLAIELSDVAGKLILNDPSSPMEISLSGFTKKEELLGSFDIFLTLKRPDGHLLLDNSSVLGLKAKIVHFPVEIIDLLATWQEPKLKGTALSFLGKEINLSVNQSSIEGIPFIDVNVESPHFNGALQGKFINGQFVLTEPATQNVNLTPLFVYLGKNIALQGKIQLKDFSLALESNNPHTPFLKTAFDLQIGNSLPIYISLEKSSQALVLNANAEKIDLSQFQPDLKNLIQSVNFTLEVKSGSKFTGHAIGSISVQNTQSSLQTLFGSKIDFSANLKGLLTNSMLSFQDLSVQMQGDLPGNTQPLNLFVESFDFPLSGSLTAIQLNGKASVKSYALQKQNGELFASLNDVQASWMVNGGTQEAKALINASTTMGNIGKAGQINFETTIQNCFTDKPKAEIKASIQDFPVAFLNAFSQCKEWEVLLGPTINIEAATNSGNESASIISLKMDSDKIGGTGSLQVKQSLLTDCQVSLDLFSKAASSQSYKMHLSGFVEQLKKPSGEWNSEPSFSGKIKAENFPTSLLCHLSYLSPKLKEQINALLGQRLNIDLTAKLKKMNGPIQIAINGTLGQVSLDGRMDNFILTLNQPLHAQFTTTPTLSEKLLKDIVPLLSSATSSEQPIKIVIDSKGFSFPLKEFDLNQINIERASIDLGKMTFSNEGQIGTILSLLSSAQSKQLNVWFTPLYFNMKEGVIQCARMDALLVDHLPIAIWGKVNLAKEKISMTIGLTAQALQSALGIKGLKEDFMMQIPFKGPLGNAGIDRTKTTARISALVAQSHGGAKGKILGNVLEIVTGGYGDKEIPPRTTDPLPWAKK